MLVNPTSLRSCDRVDAIVVGTFDRRSHRLCREELLAVPIDACGSMLTVRCHPLHPREWDDPPGETQIVPQVCRVDNNGFHRGYYDALPVDVEHATVVVVAVGSGCESARVGDVVVEAVMVGADVVDPPSCHWPRVVKKVHRVDHRGKRTAVQLDVWAVRVNHDQ